MSHQATAGRRLRQALEAERPLQVVGAINAYCALLAREAGFRALYLSGAGVANAAFALPDLGLITLNDVAEETRRITRACDLPLLVDVDVGYGSSLMIARAIRELEQAGAAGVQIEDQQAAKRCGHRPGKRLVSAQAMVTRLRAAVEARSDPDFVIVARTDAYAVESIEGVIERGHRYAAAGVDMLFPEALTEPMQFRAVADAVDLPVMANLTEFGRTPLLHVDELRQASVALALYPLTAFRAMAATAEQVYRRLRQDGTQDALLPAMQTREQLYQVLDYHRFEQLLEQEANDEQED